MASYRYKQLVPPEDDMSGTDCNDRPHEPVSRTPCWVKVCFVIMGMAVFVLASAVLWFLVREGRSEMCLTPECVDVSASIVRNMNESVDPCTDFYTYACGGWETNTFIPPERAKYDTFAQVLTNNQAIVKRLLDDNSTDFRGTQSSAVAKVKIYYRACMDVGKIEADGTGPMQKIIEDVGSWSISPTHKNESTVWDLTDMLVKFHRLGCAPLLSFGMSTDDKNSSRYFLSFQQSGLTLDSMEEYNSTDADKFRKAFLEFAVAVGKLLGGDDVSTQTKMEAIYNFEKQMAEIFMTKEELMDPASKYNLMTVAEFQKLIGDQVNVKRLMSELMNRTFEDSQIVQVSTVNYFRKLGPLLANTSQQLLQDYSVWHMIQRIPGYLPQAFVDAAMALNKAEIGVSTTSPRWERCISKAMKAFGFVTGSLYVNKVFPPESKALALEILTAVQNEFITNLDTLSWMDAATKEQARIKAKAMEKALGYPDWILDPKQLDDYYKQAEVKEGGLLNNFFSVCKFEVAKEWQKYNKKPNKNEWSYKPDEVNAFFSITHNQIVILAGLLQKPFFSRFYPISVRYGAMGMFAGHELTHGFDDSGRKFDEHGNMNDWWSNESAMAFTERSKCMVDQYSQFSYNGRHLNGEYSLGENMADNGGLKFGYKAYQKAKVNSPPELRLPGLMLNPEQLFFVGFAQGWCAHYTPEYAANAILSDEHSISKFRVLGAVSNLPQFAKAFQCPADSPLNPSHRCSIW